MHYPMTVLLLGLSLATLTATLTATIAGILARFDGASPATALTRAGVAFGGALTLALLIIGLIATVDR